MERRKWPRYMLNWPIRLMGEEPTGAAFQEEGLLQNISVNGALAHLTRELDIGTELHISIRMPLESDIWMSYGARVVRVEKAPSGISAALGFQPGGPVISSNK